MENVTLATVILGLILGAVMLSATTYVYVRHQKFALGGSILTAFGTLLLGMTIWKSVEFSIGPEGGITASFHQQIEALGLEVRTEIAEANQTIVNEISVLRSEVHSISTAGLSDEALSQLQSRERVAQLIENGQYLDALKLDPRNTIAIMRHIEQSVRNGEYGEATKYYDQLVQANESGVGYSVYPDLVLAFTKLGKSSQALKLVEVLNARINEDIANGYGYYSRSQQLGWLDGDLKAKLPLIRDNGVSARIEALRNEIQATISVLRGS